MKQVCVDEVVVPGNIVEGIAGIDDKSKVVLGPGLRRISDKVIVCKSGILRTKNPNSYWVDTHQKRYIPIRGEHVVGIVASKAGDFFKIDIGCSEQASLYYLSFEGATKKNRPVLNVGDVLYAVLIIASKDMEPVLTCIDNATGKQGKMGPLKADGFLFRCSLNLIKKILNPKCCILNILGTKIKHEIAIGMNGRIWVRANNIKSTIAVSSAILAAEHLTNPEIEVKCLEIFQRLL